ncbi:MAG TPA: COX15/CtaA family protein [Gammaproteobacteria bacterium]|nr:COX15/CtaA family protein [Gammaproteobacteria bacterium]
MKRLFVFLARAGTLLALIVVVVGAWVRLTDAGLGCPDWPGCYGQLTVPETLSAEALADPDLAARPLEPEKAWNEMFHRYLATTLGLIAVALAALAWLNREDADQPIKVPAVLLIVVIFQGLLGMWTVTLLLKPIVVVAHLLGGLTTLSLLFWLGGFRVAPIWAGRRLRALALAALAALGVQLFLGGWTSANYAALACPDFPTCQTQWWPAIADFGEGFVLWRELGVNYEGGVLEHPARVAIHFVHRLGAIVATVLLGWLALRLVQHPASRLDGGVMLAALLAQLSLGVAIVLLGVPLAVAVAHNGVAAVLLLTVINAHKRIWQS